MHEALIQDFILNLLLPAALLTVFAWSYLLICLLQIRICKKESAAAAAATVVSYLLYCFLVHFREIPLLLIAGGFLLQLALLTATTRYTYRKYRSHLSAMSFKEGFDTLPTGLCFYRADGMPKMVNLKMNSLYAAITGEHLSNAEDFFRSLTDAVYPCSVSGGEQPIICMPDGTAYSFTHSMIEVRGEQIHELIASDITELYNMTKDLEVKQKQIRQINRRLKALNSTMRYVIMEKELLSIKTRIHDALGQTLLLSRRYLLAPEQVDAAGLISQWKNSFGLLLHEERETWQVPYLVNTQQAALLGIRLTVQGTLPEEEHLIPVIDTAIAVHTTNVLRHAEGKCAEIRVEDTGPFYTLHFTNDGIPPRSGIKETGGLSNLRRMTERIGGGMKIRSLPAFELVLKLPKQKSEHTL